MNLWNLHSKINSYKCHYYSNNLCGKDYSAMLNVLNSTSVLNLLTQNTFKSSKFICMPHNTNNEDFGLLIRKSNIISIIFMCNPYYCGANMQRMYNILIYRFESWLLRFLHSVSHVSDKLCQSDFMIAPIIRCMIYDWESKATSCMFIRKKAIHRWMICGSVCTAHFVYTDEQQTVAL